MSEIGQAIETARRAKGWTQGDLAEVAGVTQAALSRYENDLRTPDSEQLKTLADALGVTPALLLHAGRIRGGLAVSAHMRRDKSARPTTWRMLEARLNMTRLHASRLFEEVSLTAESQVPTFDPDAQAPADAARLVRAQWRMPLGPVRSLISWMEAAGILVIEDDFGQGARVDGMSQWVDDHPVILINSAVPTDRKRWTLAHELGHLVMHSNFIDDDAEDQANSFAGEFLMPADEIRPTLHNIKLGTLLDLKRSWGVSIAALIERAHGLGCMTPAQRSSMYKMMNARGIRRDEPGSAGLPAETPRLAAHIAQALQSKGLDAHEIASLAGFPRPEDNTLFPVEAPRRLRAVL